MRRNGSIVFRVVASAASIAVCLSCGGQSEKTSGGSEARGGTTATGGTTSTGGTTATGGAPATGGIAGSGGCNDDCPLPGSCVYGGRIYVDGESFPSTDGCNGCFCDDGAVVCTTRDCPPPDECERLSVAYAEALAEAKRCEPNGEFTSCGLGPVSSLPCGCPTTVSIFADLSVLEALAESWNDYGCGQGVVCGACPPPAMLGYCSRERVCGEVYPE